ncbi:hypothetical protein [uncultured Fibrobacter sp.]|uniref:hypothetical protein n=1 Tax=uncultured Fibrobacter sp. TaxID=261512 RepID=UPI002805AF84|nr:hypothetical protein [uncultured Fibrobacter sp.]
MNEKIRGFTRFADRYKNMTGMADIIEESLQKLIANAKECYKFRSFPEEENIYLFV